MDTNSSHKQEAITEGLAPGPASALAGALTAALFVVFVLLTLGPSWWCLPAGLLVMAAAWVFTYYFVARKLERRIRALNAANEQEIAKLKKMEAFRREFIGDVSHELKTPIFTIEGFLETLLDGALEDPRVNRKFLQKALKNSERLSNLVQDILVINQIESGELEMNLEKFRIHDLLEELVEALEHKFTKHGRNIRYEIVANGNESSLVLADKERIEQVLRNLIDNAVKYGDPQGRVLLTLHSRGPEKIEVQVTDNGPGISEEHLSRLFERFYRVDKSRSREKGGTGLGLSICKHFIEAHRERIWVQSAPGKGSTFMFTLSKTV